jgi:hypothetical protein
MRTFGRSDFRAFGLLNPRKIPDSLRRTTLPAHERNRAILLQKTGAEAAGTAGGGAAPQTLPDARFQACRVKSIK